MIAEFLHSVQDRLFPPLFVEARLWVPLSHSLAVWFAKLGFYSKLEPFYSQFLVDLLNNLRPLTQHFSEVFNLLPNWQMHSQNAAPDLSLCLKMMVGRKIVNQCENIDVPYQGLPQFTSTRKRHGFNPLSAILR